MSFKYYEDPILGKGRAQIDTGSGGSGGVEYLGGYRITIAGGTISNDRYMPIESVTGSSVTLQAGHAYKVYATSTAITLNTETVPDGKFGLEGHLEIYVSGTGYVVTGSNVVLANALEPDAVNNCTIRFHDGLAIISVEDHVAGYIVVNGSTSGDGSLYYGISTSTNDYVAFDASLNGTVIPLAGATAEGEKHIVGNGYAETAISGAIDCSTNKVTVANLSLLDVGITGGTLTLGDAFIPSGSTVAVSGGELAVEKVVGDGTGVIDLGGTSLVISSGATAYVSGASIVNGSGGGAGILYVANNSAIVSNCLLSNGVANNFGGIVSVRGGGYVELTGCTVAGGTAAYGQGLSCSGTSAIAVVSNTLFTENGSAYAAAIFLAGTSAVVSLTGCTFGTGGRCYVANGGTLILNGSNTFDVATTNALVIGGNETGKLHINTGAVVDITGNAGSSGVVIAPPGGITFEPGGATVYPSAGSAAAVTLGGCIVGAIDSAGNMLSSFIVSSGAVVTGNANIILTAGETVVSGCTIIGLTFSGNTGIVPRGGATIYLNDCTINTDLVTATTNAQKWGNFSIGGTCSIKRIYNIDGYNSGTVTISSGASINLTSSIAPGGGIVVEDGGCVVNGVEVTGGTYTSIVSSGGSAVINQ